LEALMRTSGLYAVFLLFLPAVAAQSNLPAWRNGAQEKMCGLGTYHDGLDLAFKNAIKGEGETLVTVQVLPSFRREYALVLKQISPEVKLLRATFEKQLWTQLGPPLTSSKTRQQCLDLALAAEIDTVEIPGKDIAAELDSIRQHQSGNRYLPAAWKTVRPSS